MKTTVTYTINDYYISSPPSVYHDENCSGWTANVVRQPDGEIVARYEARTRDEALRKARNYIAKHSH